MDVRARREILEFVKPLAVGLDGVTNFGDVERVLLAAQRIAGTGPDDIADRVFLLAVFSGQGKWARQFAHGSRIELFLGGLGIDRAEIAWLRRALARFDSAPASPEEDIVHDAVRLERVGAYGIARMVVEAHRERMTFAELAQEIERAAEIHFRTERGRGLAARRIAGMREFARNLRDEVEELSV